jgi:heme-degrading monooxygenase HmoA
MADSCAGWLIDSWEELRCTNYPVIEIVVGTMETNVLIIMYRWRLKEGHEAIFREGWREMTESIYRLRGSKGSRLHRAEDGTWVAYAQWPDEETWRRAREAGSANEAAAQKMREGSAELISEERLQLMDNLLRNAI